MIGTDHPEVETPDPFGPESLSEAEAVFTRWLGKGYDLDAIRVAMAAVAVERLDGDPLWLLIVSGSGNAKTETVQALAGSGALVTSTITSEGALLSATSFKERSKDATGGLLRKIGPRGVLVIKDVTSILSMNSNVRQAVLAAIREVYDGRWSRNVGTDGGRTLEWEGRIVLVGAVTTAWDAAHGVIAAMGDRFVLLRVDSSDGDERKAAGLQALRNTGHEEAMRDELAAAVTAVIAAVDTTSPPTLTEGEELRLFLAADLVTRARTAVESDPRGEPMFAHAPEYPTRFAKQLQQVVRGCIAIGMDREDAMSLGVRCARDSMPPLRLAVMEAVGEHAYSTVTEVMRYVQQPRTTVDRTLQALHMLGVLTRGEGTSWTYALRSEVDLAVIDP